MSEYDNLTNQYAPTSHKSHASTGTVFCKPWENSNLFETLMDPKNCKLPPPMDLNERIHAWQAASFNKDSHTNRDSVLSDTTLIDDTDFDDETPTNRNNPAVFIEPPPEDLEQEVKGRGIFGSNCQGRQVLGHMTEDEHVPTFPLNLSSNQKPTSSHPGTYEDWPWPLSKFWA